MLTLLRADGSLYRNMWLNQRDRPPPAHWGPYTIQACGDELEECLKILGTTYKNTHYERFSDEDTAKIINGLQVFKV